MSGETIWIDDPNPIFRRGLSSCLTDAGYVVVGESARFDGAPPSRTHVLIFGADRQTVPLAARLAGGAKLVAIIASAEESGRDAIAAGAAGLLLRGELVPDTLVACIRGVLQGIDVLPHGLLGRFAGTLPAVPNRTTIPAGSNPPPEPRVLVGGFDVISTTGLANLLREAGYGMTHAPLDAVAGQASSEWPDAVVLDIEHDADLARARQVHHLCPGVPVIACSGSRSRMHVFPASGAPYEQALTGAALIGALQENTRSTARSQP